MKRGILLILSVSAFLVYVSAQSINFKPVKVKSAGHKNVTGSTSAVLTSFITDAVTAPANDDCSGAILISQTSSCSPTTGTTVGATQSIPAITCAGWLGSADDDVWYKFVATTSNPIIKVVGSGLFDAVVDLRSGACDGTNIACADGSYSGGTETINAAGLTVGSTYYVRVYSYDGPGYQETFTICVYSPASLPQDIDVIPTSLTIYRPPVATNSLITSQGETDHRGISNATAKQNTTVDLAVVDWNQNHTEKELVIKFNSARKFSVNQSLLYTSGDPDINAVFRDLMVDKLRMIYIGKNLPGELQNTYVIHYLKDTPLPTAFSLFEGISGVEWVNLNYLYPVDIVPNDPQYGQQWYLPQINAPNAWSKGTGSPGVSIGVIDTGVDWDHPDLAASVWVNPGEIPGNGLDDDVNGYIDDVRGWDWVDNTANAAAGEDGDDPDNNPMDFQGHGTHCSGLVAATTNNGVGIASISWGCKIMCLRAGYETNTGGGLVQFAAAASAIAYAIDNGGNVLNMSFGGGASLLTPVINAFNNNLVVCHSAGNDNSSSGSPIDGIDQTISVAATDQTDQKASFSNYGSWIDVSAPGVSIYSTVFNDSYASFNGTSMASPIVAGLASLLKSANPTLTAQQIISVIKSTADNINAQNPGYIGQLGTGRINAYAAMNQVSGSQFIIQNLGDSPLSISSITDNQSWLTTSGYPATPFNIAGAGSQAMDVAIDWSQIGCTTQTATITITSNDPDEPAVMVTVSAVPTVTIKGSVKDAGNIGIPGVTVTFTNLTPPATTTNALGNYSVAVPCGYSGIATPSKNCIAFNPLNRTYSNVTTDQVSQNYQGTIQSVSLPYTEPFTNTTIPDCWTQADHQGNGQVWQFGTIAGITISGNYAFLNSDGYGNGNTQNADLISPVFDFTSYTGVNLQFQHYFQEYTGQTGTVSYSINNGSTWTPIQVFTTTTPVPAAFSQSIPGVAGHSQVLFKWNFTGTYGWYWAIDDVSITGTYQPLLVNPSSRSLGPSGGAVTFSVTTAVPWTATSDQSWCSVTPSGVGSGTLTATCTSNITPATRTATITVTIAGNPPVTVTVNQTGLLPPTTLAGNLTVNTVHLSWNRPFAFVSPPGANPNSMPPASFQPSREVANHVGPATIPPVQTSLSAGIDGTTSVLFNNGPLVNSPGTGFGGADESVLFAPLNIYGFGAQQGVGNSVADDFVVPPGNGWDPGKFTFFVYQTGSSTASPITGLYFRIYNGDPSATGSVIWGDLTTNRMTATSWTNIYRTDAVGGPTDRPVMKVEALISGLHLSPGTYWVEYQFIGSALFTGPWVPPITITGTNTTGNAMQYNGSWAPVYSDVYPQGLPFYIEDGGGSIPDGLIGYNIYRNGSFHFFNNGPDAITYDDAYLPEGSYSYLVKAKYDLTQYGFPGLYGESAAIGPYQAVIGANPARIDLPNYIIGSGQGPCYSATQIIHVAGNGSTFIVQPGGSVTLVSGGQIFLLPGTTVLAQGYLHGYITTTGSYCVQPTIPLPIMQAVQEDVNPGKFFRIYPNPSTGKVTLELKTGKEIPHLLVRIYNMMGAEILRKDLKGSLITEFSLGQYPPGIYIVNMMGDGITESATIVKL